MFLKITESKIDHEETSFGLLITMYYIVALPSGELLKIKGQARMSEDFIHKLYNAEKELKNLSEQKDRTYDSKSYIALSSPYFLMDEIKEEKYKNSSLVGKRDLLDKWIKETKEEITSLNENLKSKDVVKYFECHNLEFEYQSRGSDGWVTFGDNRVSIVDYGLLDFELKDSTYDFFVYFDALKNIDTICKKMVNSSVSKYFNINPVFSF